MSHLLTLIMNLIDEYYFCTLGGSPPIRGHGSARPAVVLTGVCVPFNADTTTIGLGHRLLQLILTMGCVHSNKTNTTSSTRLVPPPFPVFVKSLFSTSLSLSLSLSFHAMTASSSNGASLESFFLDRIVIS